MRIRIPDSQRKLAALVLAVTSFAVGGMVLAQVSLSSVAIEAESGTLAGGVSRQSDTTASGQSHLAFSTTTTTPPPSDVQFLETFTGNTGLDRFTWGVYHRNAGWQVKGQALQSTGWDNAMHGGSWSADHDMDCGGVTTQRPLSSTKTNFNIDKMIFNCRDHMMTSMGDVDGYSVTWFSPDRSFPTVKEASVNVNLTDLGTRQWIKLGIISEARYFSRGPGGVFPENDAPGFVVSDVGASSLDGNLEGPGLLVASWSGGASAGYPGGLKIGNTNVSGGYNAGTDKATRYPMILRDNGNGTITFSVNGSAGTRNGSFPTCPCRVVYYGHYYTPSKSESGTPIGYTFHWDDVQVK